MKSFTKLILTIAVAASLATTQSCAFFFKSEFVEIKAEELSALVEALPDNQKRQLAQNKAMRDQFITQFKTPFALAQAAEAEGLHKTDEFKQEMAFRTDQTLAGEYNRRNPDAIVSKEESDAYFNAHKAQFDSFFTLITRNAKQAPSDSDKEMMHEQWSQIQVLAEKGRQAGIEKEAGVQVQLKIGKASLLANAYSKSVSDKMVMTPEEKKRYVSEHPEADVDKIKEKAQALLTRVKNGEDFATIAKEFNEDDTKTTGGEMPWFDKEGKVGGSPVIDEPYVQAAFALEKGGVSEVVKSRVGFHVVKLDDKRIYDPSKEPKPAATPAPLPGAQPTPTPTPEGPQEQVRTRHIFLSTMLADTFEEQETQAKVKRVMEDATLKYPVKLPTDFTINVAGYNPSTLPGLGGGSGGTMKGIDPNANK